MADAKISALTNLTAADAINDMIPIVDVSDTPPASGNTKRISINNILSSSPTASGALTVTGLVTAGSASITGAATVGTTLGVTGVSTFAAGTALLPALTTTGDTNTGIYYPAADTFAVTTGGTERVRVNSSGIVGVAITPSAWDTANYNALQVSRTAVASLSNIGIFAANWFADTGGDKYIATATAARIDVNNSGQIQFKIAPSGTAGNAITFTQAMTLDASGNLLVGVTSANANGGVLQLKSGITFPATQVAASDANTLDDYEEGTWTGTLTGGTTNPTIPVTATGRYTKIGRVVTVTINFNNVITTGASGSVTITGLPFTNNASNTAQGAMFHSEALTFTGSPFLFIEASDSILQFKQSISNVPTTNCTHNAGTGRYLQATAIYSV